MNEIYRPSKSDTPGRRAVTQAPDGLPRLKWHVDDIQEMLAAGILDEDDNVERIGGELVVMAAKGRAHEVLRTKLVLRWARTLPADIKIATETPLRLGDHEEPEPDIIVYPSHLKAPDVRGDTVLLVVDVADTSLAIDLDRKA